jgi:uncharacterized protein (DUF1778 family)
MKRARKIAESEAGRVSEHAAAYSAASPTNAVLNIRVRSRDRLLIDAAAEALGKTRSEFVLATMRREAEEVLLDRRIFPLSESEYNEFLSRLDAAPAPNNALSHLLKSTSPWE